MVNQTRKSYSGKFKLKVALEAVKERMPIEDICAKFGIAINQVYAWKKLLEDNGEELFEDKRKRKEKQICNINKIELELEEVKKERDFLARVLSL